jgi:ABC-type antimicrobial peptide transport system permease subunit
VLIIEGFARRLWPGESAIGKRIALGSATNGWRTVVGVVEESRMTSMLGEIPLTTWLPREQSPLVAGGQVLVIRTTTEPGTALAAARRIVTQENPRVAVARMETMDAVIDRALAEPLRLRFFLSLFAALALILGAVGVFGVVSYAVARRRAEFGIRMALGAAPARVLVDVVRLGMLPVAVGVSAGVLLSLALAGAIRSFLYDVSPMDPSSLTTSAALLLLAGSLAALVPGWRARRVSPVEALRSDQ